jgi:uncharacterized protein YndB with AHSA1/START domain
MKPEKQRPTFTIERSYEASVEDAWALWTTKEGIESFWGPDGFTVTVQKIDLRAGGELRYSMTATAAPQIQFLEKAKLPLTTVSRATYREIVPKTRLAWTQHVDWVPGVEPYAAEISVDLHATAKGVRLVVSSSVMHDEQWTKMAKLGWESQLERFGKRLARQVA